MHGERKQDAASRCRIAAEQRAARRKAATVDRLNWNLVPCIEHDGMMCHVNQSGDHVNPKHCCCRPGMLSIYCPIDLHNPILYTAETLSAIERDNRTPEERERVLSNWINRHSQTPTLF